MQAVHVRSHVSNDGTLEVKVPTDFGPGEVDVTLIIHPVRSDIQPSEKELEDSRRFVAQTAGSWEGEALQRPAQGEYEKREEWG